MRILTHATYHAQRVLVQLLDIAAERGVVLQDALSSGDRSFEDKVRDERLELWSEIRSVGT